MALKISLKPHERLIVGGAVITNGDTKSELIVENSVPVLREKDILREKDVDSPCKRIYFAIQLMYVDQENLEQHHRTYWELVRDLFDAAPSRGPILQEISNNVLNMHYYKALKLTRSLVAYEQEAMENVRSTHASI
jgi:flagellar biosynthesis repressor protein FlbT